MLVLLESIPHFLFFLCKNGPLEVHDPQFFNGNHIGRTISAERQRQREDAAKLLSRAVRGVWGGPTLMVPHRIHPCMVYFPIVWLIFVW